MSEDNITDLPPREERPSRLRDAMRKARLTEAERSDVIVNLREAEIARLELLQDALADVFAEIPSDNDLLECSLLPGNPPRLWIDVLAYVAMGRDKRTYRFVKDTRHGRQLISESAHLEEMADRVTDYVAHRLLERQRALEFDEGKAVVSLAPAAEETIAEPAPAGNACRAGVVVAFIAGIVTGAAGLFGLGLYLISQ